MLVTKNEVALRATARRHSLCAADVDDAYQRALLIAFQKAPEIPTSDLLRWLHTVIRNEAHAVRRSRERLLGVEDHPESRISENEPFEYAERRERVALAARALATLKPHERRALALKAVGLSYVEIAELCGWTYTKVNRCLAEGSAAARERLERLEAVA